MTIERYDHVNTRVGQAGSPRSSSLSYRRISRSVGVGAQERRKVVVDTAANSTPYTITLAGVALTITSDGDATKPEIVAALLAAVEANQDLLAAFQAEADPDATDALLITRRAAGVAFTLTAGANLTASLVQAADAGAAIPPGVVVCQDASSEGGAVLPSAITPVAQVTTLTPTPQNSTRYTLTLTADLDGNGPAAYFVEYTSDADATAAEIVDGLVSAIEARWPEEIGAANVANELVLTGPAGVPFTVVPGASAAAATWAQEATTAAVAPGFAASPLGVVVLEQRLEMPVGGGLTAHPVGDPLTIAQSDEVAVLLDAGAAVALGNPVFVRCTASASEQLGACRADADGGDCLRLAGATFTGASFTGLDGQNIAFARLQI